MKERMSQEAYVYVILASAAVPHHQQRRTTRHYRLNRSSGSLNCRGELGGSGSASQTAQGPNCLSDQTTFLRTTEDSGTTHSHIFNLWLIVKVVGTIVWWRHGVIPRVNTLIQQEWHIKWQGKVRVEMSQQFGTKPKTSMMVHIRRQNTRRMSNPAVTVYPWNIPRHECSTNAATEEATSRGMHQSVWKNKRWW